MPLTPEEEEEFTHGVADAFLTVADNEAALISTVTPHGWASLRDAATQLEDRAHPAKWPARDWYYRDGQRLAQLQAEAESDTLSHVPPYTLGWLLGLDAAGVHGWSWENNPINVLTVDVERTGGGIKIHYQGYGEEDEAMDSEV